MRGLINLFSHLKRVMRSDKRKNEALKKHHEWNGKIEVVSRAPVTSREDLALAYTPGVADACMAIVENPEEAYRVTRKII
jgi:Malic enzyme